MSASRAGFLSLVIPLTLSLTPPTGKSANKEPLNPFNGAVTVGIIKFTINAFFVLI